MKNKTIGEKKIENIDNFEELNNNISAGQSPDDKHKNSNFNNEMGMKTIKGVKIHNISQIDNKKENATKKVASKIMHHSPRDYNYYNSINYINFSVCKNDAEDCLSSINGNATVSQTVSRPETSGFESQLRRLCTLSLKNISDNINIIMYNNLYKQDKSGASVIDNNKTIKSMIKLEDRNEAVVSDEPSVYYESKNSFSSSVLNTLVSHCSLKCESFDQIGMLSSIDNFGKVNSNLKVGEITCITFPSSQNKSIFVIIYKLVKCFYFPKPRQTPHFSVEYKTEGFGDIENNQQRGEISNLSLCKIIKLNSKSLTSFNSLSNFENDDLADSISSYGILNQTTENILDFVYVLDSKKSSSFVTNTLFSDFEKSASLPLSNPFDLRAISTFCSLKNLSNLWSTFSSNKNLTLEGDIDNDIFFSSSNISRIFQCCNYMLSREGRECLENFFKWNSCSKHFQNLPDHDSSSFKSKFSMTDAAVSNNVWINFNSHQLNVIKEAMRNNVILQGIEQYYSIINSQ